MKHILIISVISFLFTSCASIINLPWTNTSIFTTEPSIIIAGKDTVRTRNNKARLGIERKKEPLEITAKTDSLEKKVSIAYKNSFAYYSNIFCNYGLGMLVDRANPKRYSYPQRVYLNSADTIGNYSCYGPANNKGELLLHVSLPHINSFYLVPENEDVKASVGFWGISIGLDYYHCKDQFINCSVAGVSDFFVPFPAAIDISGEYELMSSRYLSISNNHKIKRFSVGYGLSYVRNTWDFRYYDWLDPEPPTREPIKKSNNAIGFIFSSYFQIGQNFNIGLVYRPTFVRPDSSPLFEYEHLISIDFAWKIRMGRMK